MAVFYGTFTKAIGTSTGDLDFVIPGLTQVPQAARFTISFAEVSGTKLNHAIGSTGFTDGTRQYSLSWVARNSRASSDTSRRAWSDNCLTLLLAGGNINGLGAFKEWINNESGSYGVRLDVTNAFNGAFQVTCEVWAGVEGAYCGTETGHATVTNSIDVTAPGFEPGYVYGVSGFCPVDGTKSDHLQIAIGHYSNATVDQQRGMSWYSENANAVSVTNGRVDTLYFLRKIDATATGVTLGIHSPDSSGFSVITRDASEAVVFAYLAIKETSVEFEVNDALTPTSTGVVDFTDPGHTSWMFSTIFSQLESTDTVETTGLGSAWAIGQLDTDLDTEGVSYSWADEDASTTTDTQCQFTDALVDIDSDDGTTPYIASFDSQSATGLNIDWTTAPSAAKVFIFASMSFAPQLAASDSVTGGEATATRTRTTDAASDAATTGDATATRTRATDADSDATTTGDATGRRLRVASADSDSVTTGDATGRRLRVASADGDSVTTGDATANRIRSTDAAGDATTGGDATAVRVRNATAAGDAVTTGDASGVSLKFANADSPAVTTGSATGGAIRSRLAASDSMTGGSAEATRVRHTTAAGDAVTTGAGTGVESGVKEGNGDGAATTTGDATGRRIRYRLADGPAITGGITSGYRKRHTGSDGGAQTGGDATGRRVKHATAAGDAVTDGSGTGTAAGGLAGLASGAAVTTGSATGGAIRRRQAADGIGTQTGGDATGRRVKHATAAGDAVTGSLATGGNVNDLSDASGAATTGGSAFARVLKRQWSSMNAITQLLLEAVRDDSAVSALRQEIRGDITEGLTERRVFPPTIDEDRNYFEIQGRDLPYLGLCTDGGNLIASRTKEMGGETVLTRQFVMILSYDTPTFEMRRYYQRALRNVINAILSKRTFMSALYPYGIEARRVVEIGGEDSGQAIQATAFYINVELVIKGTRLGTSV
ncbi:MAG: hypothetical protein ACI88C_000050 [Acidimicrobiales bacterium]|jgi:hypothetical protein